MIDNDGVTKKEKSVLCFYANSNINEFLLFKSLTSLTPNRQAAERLGNTLLIVDSNVNHIDFGDPVRCGMDISKLSHYPNEEEFLMWPATMFRFVKSEFDHEKKKYIVYLKASRYNGSYA